MKAVPIYQKEANAYVDKHHRHHKHVAGDIFRVACEEDGEIVGVIQVGRPLSRMIQDGMTVEVLRCCTNGRPNVASFLYSRAARIAKELGYRKIITYILESEPGTSLKASGWKCEESECGGWYMVQTIKTKRNITDNLIWRRGEVSNGKETEMV